MKLRTGDTLVVSRGGQTVTGVVTRVEADGFWIESPDGMPYRFGLSRVEPAAEGPPSEAP